VVENQYHDLDEFLDAVDLVVVMVGHDEIRENREKMKNKVVLDTRNVCGGGCYHL
jgi:UDP-N-acetyl-D-mannosaminuronic acid dehydrogenase